MTELPTTEFIKRCSTFIAFFNYLKAPIMIIWQTSISLCVKLISIQSGDNKLFSSISSRVIVFVSRPKEVL